MASSNTSQNIILSSIEFLEFSFFNEIEHCVSVDKQYRYDAII